MKNNNGKKYISIRARLFLEVGAVILVAVTFILSLNNFLLPAFYVYNERRTMKNVCAEIDAYLATGAAAEQYVAQEEKNNGFSIDIYGEDGSPVYIGTDDIFSSSGKVTVSQRKEYDDGSFYEIQTNTNSDKQYIVFGAGLQSGGEIEMFSSKEYIDYSSRIIVLIANATSVTALLLALVFIYYYAGRFTKPLIAMSKITGKMAEMDFTQKCEFSNRNDEIAVLSSSINHLSDSLNTTLQDLNRKNEKLKDDIEKEKNLEKIRKEFISNVSHELKTPISIIRGYSEGAVMMLESGDENSAKSYCDVIVNETEKMNALVLQLLELSKYESGNIEISKEKFDIFDMINDYALGAEIKLKENSITFENKVQKGIKGIGDTIKLEMIVNNYISNAVSHAGGEKRIRVSSEEMPDCYRISVFNTGENIPDDEIDKIWISFYRADKSRSRSEGRFGLGLSIVSAIQKLHQRDFGVYNTPDGVCFWFDIEKA